MIHTHVSTSHVFVEIPFHIYIHHLYDHLWKGVNFGSHVNYTIGSMALSYQQLFWGSLQNGGIEYVILCM